MRKQPAGGIDELVYCRSVTDEAGTVRLLLHGHDPHLGEELIWTIEGGLAKIDHSVTVTEVGADLRLIHQAVADEMAVTGPNSDLLRNTSPERGSRQVARVLVQPTDQSGVRSSDAQEATPYLAFRGTDQLVDQLILRADGPDQVMGPEKHVGPVVPFELLLEVVDQGRVDVLTHGRP